jgi:hypothetical protein
MDSLFIGEELSEVSWKRVGCCDFLVGIIGRRMGVGSWGFEEQVVKRLITCHCRRSQQPKLFV